MSIVKEIIELHDSEITFNSEKGKGTEFTVILKSSENPEENNEVKDTQQKKARNKKKSKKK